MASRNIPEKGQSEVCECVMRLDSDENSNTLWDLCQKNPGHPKFIPIKNFSELCIPDIFSQIHRPDNDDRFKAKDDLMPVKEFRSLLHQLVLAMASLTVFVQVSFTSFNRPDTLPNDPSTPYSGSDMKGQKKSRFATGFIFSDCPVDEGQSDPYPECQSSTGRTKAVFLMQTATHTLFDEDELQYTNIYFDYDDEASKSQLKTAEPVDIILKDVENDVCLVRCVTHDGALIKRVEENLKTYRRLRGEVYQILKSKKVVYVRDYVTSFWSSAKLVLIVGHPHGKPKMVSVGYRIKRLGEEGSVCGKSSYLYDTCTCPGSSGGPVYVLGAPYEFIHHSHSGAMEEGNYCGDGVWKIKGPAGEIIYTFWKSANKKKEIKN